MIWTQAVNGKFYANAKFFSAPHGPVWQIHIGPDQVALYYHQKTRLRNDLNWASARKVLKAAGIKARKLTDNPMNDELGYMVTEDGPNLFDAYIFFLKIGGPIPIPACHSGVCDDPGPDFEISFDGRKATKNGRKKNKLVDVGDRSVVLSDGSGQ